MYTAHLGVGICIQHIWGWGYVYSTFEGIQTVQQFIQSVTQHILVINICCVTD